MGVKYTSKAILLLLCISLNQTILADAEKLSLTLSSGLRVNADYWQGESDQPSVMIVHGFLQTSSFSTVRRLAESLADSGYSVLTPTLSLGLDDRQQSLSCEAMHLHTMQSDTEEIGLWVDKLKELSGKSPVLVAHSAGSIQAIAYLDNAPKGTVDRSILISLTAFGEGPGAFETLAIAKDMQAMADAGVERLVDSALAFCKTYLTTPKGFLSYYEWSGDRIKASMAENGVDNHVVVGGKDPRIDLEWIYGLQKSGATVHEVAGANHFFDQAHEFDLLDEVEALLN